MAVVLEDDAGSHAGNTQIRDFLNRICDDIQIVEVARILQSRM